MSKDIIEDNWNKAIAIIKRDYIDYMLRKFHKTAEMANALDKKDKEKVDELNIDWTVDYLFDNIDMYLTSPFKIEE